MRGKTKIQTALIASLIAWLFAASFAILPVSSEEVVATIWAPDIIDETFGPGSTVPISILITDVEDLWAYEFTLSFDTTIITPIEDKPIKYTAYPPFTIVESVKYIPGDPDVIVFAARMPYHVKEGFDGSIVVATIYFTVNEWGGTVLDLADTGMVIIGGWAMRHNEIDGFFSNKPVAYGVELRRAIPENQVWAETVDPDNTLHAKAKNKGSVSTSVYVEFQIEDESGLMFATANSETVILERNRMHDFTITVDKFWLIGHGAPVPSVYQTYYVHVKVWFYVGGGLWESGRQIMKFHFTLYPDVPEE